MFFKLAKLFGKKTIVHLHCGNQLLECWNQDYQDMYSRCDAGVALSNNILNIIQSHVGKKDNLQVVFNPCPNIGRAVDESEHKKEIIYSGTLYEGKGYRDLIRAFGKISNKYPDWKLVFAGNGEVQIGKDIAIECGIIDQCVFLDWVSGDAKDRAYRSASILCLPSYAEGFPMAVLDAWAYGLPVITTPVGGIPDVAKDGENMLLFNPGDIDMLAMQLDKLISSCEGDHNLYNKIKAASVDFAANIFNVNTINSQIGNLYEKLSK